MHRPFLVLSVLFALLAACDGAPELGCYTNSAGCYCSSDIARSDPNTCAATEQGLDGFCCRSAQPGADACWCTRPACSVSAFYPDICTCGTDDFDPLNSRADSCAPPSGGHCCQSSGGPIGALCTCSPLTCISGDTEVSSCSPSSVADCGDAEPTDRCD